jgi:hypothetical protein
LTCCTPCCARIRRSRSSSLGLGYLLGKIALGGFKPGSDRTLLAGVIVVSLGITLPGEVKQASSWFLFALVSPASSSRPATASCAAPRRSSRPAGWSSPM